MTFKLTRFRRVNTSFLPFLLITALILLVDGTMSYVFPIAVEETMDSNLIMGWIMGSSSLVGFFSDILLPHWSRGSSWKFLMALGGIFVIGFPIFTFLGVSLVLIPAFVLAAALWGIYYEMIFMGVQEYVVTEDKPKSFTFDWGVLSLVIGITYLTGPLIGETLMEGDMSQLLWLCVPATVALFLILRMRTRDVRPEIQKEVFPPLPIRKQLKLWATLGSRIWPALLVSLSSAVFSSLFAVLGGLLGESLYGEDGSSWLIYIAFDFPVLIMSIGVMWWQPRTHKKLLSQLSLVVGGLLMMAFFVVEQKEIVALISLIAGLCSSMAWILNSAVFSELQKRTPRAHMHVAALLRVQVSIAYMVGPVILGYLADDQGYLRTFAIVGAAVFALNLLLIFLTPRKLHIPQHEVEEILNS